MMRGGEKGAVASTMVPIQIDYLQMLFVPGEKFSLVPVGFVLLESDHRLIIQTFNRF